MEETTSDGGDNENSSFQVIAKKNKTKPNIVNQKAEASLTKYLGG